MENTIQSAPAQQKKHVSNQEFVLFLISVFFYTNMTGMVNGYRQAYLVNVLRLDSGSVSLINAICGILGFALSFFYAIIMDNRKKSKLGKFRPLGLASAVPMGILTVMMFVTPQMPLPIMIAYLCTVQLLQGAASYFGNSVNMVGVVMTPNTQERDKILSFRGISKRNWELGPACDCACDRPAAQARHYPDRGDDVYCFRRAVRPGRHTLYAGGYESGARAYRL